MKSCLRFQNYLINWKKTSFFSDFGIDKIKIFYNLLLPKMDKNSKSPSIVSRHLSKNKKYYTYRTIQKDK